METLLFLYITILLRCKSDRFGQKIIKELQIFGDNAVFSTTTAHVSFCETHGITKEHLL